MQKMVEIFNQKVNPQPTEISWAKVREVAIGIAVTAIFSAVPVGGGIAGRVAYGIITDAIPSLIVGQVTEEEAAKHYTPTGPNRPPNSETSWADLVSWFVDEANRIGNELYIAIVPSAEASGGLSQVMFGQLVDITNQTEAGTGPPEVPGFVPRSK